jgi:hypothetical protein
MRLAAKVCNITGETTHSVAAEGGALPREAPVYVEIVEQEGAYYLFRHDAEGVCIGDTWHLTLDEAKEQAAFEFDIGETEWEVPTSEASRPTQAI